MERLFSGQWKKGGIPPPLGRASRSAYHRPFKKIQLSTRQRMWSLSGIWDLLRNMGLRYVGYRIGLELSRRSGLLQYRFPVRPPMRVFITLSEWQKNAPVFFFSDRSALDFHPGQMPFWPKKPH